MSLTAPSSSVVQFPPQTKPGFFKLRHSVTCSTNWHSLGLDGIGIFTKIAEQYRPYNKGDILYGIGDAKRDFRIGYKRAKRGFQLIEDHGFAICTQEGQFDYSTKDEMETKWRLTPFVLGSQIEPNEQNPKNHCVSDRTQHGDVETDWVSDRTQRSDTGSRCETQHKVDKKIDKKERKIDKNKTDSEFDFQTQDRKVSLPKAEKQATSQEGRAPSEATASSAATPLPSSSPPNPPVPPPLPPEAALLGAGRPTRGVAPAGTRWRGAKAEDCEGWLAAEGRTPIVREPDGSLIVPDWMALKVLQWVAAGRPDLYEPMEMAPALGPDGDSLADFVP